MTKEQPLFEALKIRSALQMVVCEKYEHFTIRAVYGISIGRAGVTFPKACRIIRTELLVSVSIAQYLAVDNSTSGQQEDHRGP